MTFFDGDRPVMHLAANGRVEMSVKHVWSGGATTIDNRVLGVIRTDGSITDPSGTKMSTLEPDGTVVSPDGHAAPFKLEADALVASGAHVTIDDRGAVLKDGSPVDPPMRVEGVADAGSRRAALLLLALVMTSAEPKPAATGP